MKLKYLCYILVFVLLTSACAPELNSIPPETHTSMQGSFVTESDNSSSATESSEESSKEFPEENELSLPPGEPLDTVLGEYSFTFSDNGKESILYFTEKQIQEFAEKKRRGQRFSITKEEFDFIVHDTLRAFEKYDAIYIHDTDGKLHKYYGLNFYTSKDYYESFNGFDLGVEDATFDYRSDLFNVLFIRLSVLSSSVQQGMEPGGIILSGTDALSEGETASLAIAFELVYNYGSTSVEHTNLLQEHGGAGILFDSRDKMVLYVSDLSMPLYCKPVYILENERLSNLIPPLIGHYKYDTGTGKAVIVELYEEATQKLIARIRLDEKNNPNEIKKYASFRNLPTRVELVREMLLQIIAPLFI